MGTTEIRAHLHKYIDKAADAQIEAIYTILEDKVEAAQDRISIEQYNKEIEESEKEYETGNHVTHSEFIKEMKQGRATVRSALECHGKKTGKKDIRLYQTRIVTKCKKSNQ